MRLTSLLALPQNITDNWQWIALGFLALILLIALICGLVKGFYRTSRKWIKFAAVAGPFFFLCKKYGDKNPIENWLPESLAADIKTYIIIGSYLLAVILAVNIVFGIIDTIVKKVAIKKLESSVEISQKEDFRARMREQKKIDAKWKPNFFSRFCGGVACILNVSVCVLLIVALIIYGCSYSSTLTGDKLAFIYDSLPEKTLDYLRTYALDTVALIVILSISYCGYRAGAANGLRAIFLTFGIFAAIVIGFLLPHAAQDSKTAIFTPVNGMTNWFTSLFEKASAEKVASGAQLFGKLLSGFVLAIIFTIVVVLLGLLLKAITRAIRRVAIIRIIDGTICFIVMFAIGVAVVGVVAEIMLSLDYLEVVKGTFKFSSLFTDSSPLQNCFKNLFDTRLVEYVDKLKQYLSQNAG